MTKHWGLPSILALLFLVVPLRAQFDRAQPTWDGEGKGVEYFRQSWRVLEPVSYRNLSIYPVVSEVKAASSDFLTLDEGIASGSVRIAERGEVENALYRRRDTEPWPGAREAWPPRGGASVNELVLVNNSGRPLLLLAGEVVWGGKQNRIIGSDLVVPPKSDPVPLTVFCVEHGRWTAGGGTFDSARAMAHPKIRQEAQVSRSQEGVWESVARAAAGLRAASPTSSYLDVLNSPEAKRKMDAAASSLEADYERELREKLAGRGAVGVVVAINGELVWSDVFTSPDLFRKYWPKLLRSYVIEAEGQARDAKGLPSTKDAQAFLREDHGRVTIKEEPGAYRRTEISARDYQLVALEALGKYGDTGLLVHYNKMARD
jgi:hypothetical protein